MKKTVIELFAGVGGFRVGLNKIKNFDKNGKAIENKDWEFVWSNQWEPSTKVQHASDCYKLRFGNSGYHSNEDISTVEKTNIPDHSLLVGGFPCQDYSVARSLSGEKGIEGKKGVLFWEIADIIKTKQTPFILLENVDRLLKSPAKQRGRDFGIMLRTFSDLGYNVEWRIINAADYGCAQKRKRIFIFAWDKNTKYNKSLSSYSQNDIMQNEGLFAKSFPLNILLNDNKEIDVTLNDFKDTVEMSETFQANFQNTGIMINGVVKTIKTTPVENKPTMLLEVIERGSILDSYFLNDAQIEKFTYLKGRKKVERMRTDGLPYFYSEGSMSFPDCLSLPARTMLTSESSINRSTHVIHDFKTDKLRYITPVEAERLQSFPDNWTNSGMPEKRRYFMMGNALVTTIISQLEETLSEIITKC